MLADYQDLPNGGNGYLRILRFSPDNDTIMVQTYSPTLDSYGSSTIMGTDTTSAEFVLSYDMEDLSSGFTAYNDCVYDPTQSLVAIDPNGQLVHYIAPNVTTYNIGTDSPGSSSGELIDFNTGASTGVTVTMFQSGGVIWQPDTSDNWYGGYDTAVGTDAYNTFHGIADMTGVIYYGSTGWYVDITFTGLDPAKEYTFATSASRANGTYTTRVTRYTISSVDEATNASTSDVTEINNLSVAFNTGDNHDEGLVARWTGIQPGSDGSFTVRAQADGSTNQAYSFDVFMLQEEGGIPPLPSLPIAKGNTWRYFKGTQEPPSDWNSIGFDDSGWAMGPSGFGYGDSDDATVLNDMQSGYISVYLRKEFTVADPSAVTTLELSMDYDDSFVAYLNGIPVARANVTGTPPAYTVAADSDHEASAGNSSPQPVEYFSIDPALLVAGTNVLAIQGHNKSIDSSDFSLIPELAEVKETASFRQGVDGYAGTVDTYLAESDPANGHGTEAAILWDTDEPPDSGQSNFLLIRFDDIFDSDGGPIPVGATIQSATLSYVVFNVGNPSDVNEVIVDWATGETYNSFGGDAGVQSDEYGVSLGSAAGTSASVQSIDVTESLARWATNPSSNRGWIFRPTGTDGVDIRSSEYSSTIAERPLLTVEYTTGGTSPTCYPLTVNHTGQGSDPVAVIANSVGCPAGEYTAGESISLVGAVPNSGWKIASWTGTVNNSSTADTNTVTMPAAALLAGVTYEEGPPPIAFRRF